LAVPKRKVSRSKRDKRRTHDRLKAVNVVECSRCHSKKISHRVCPNCGYYHGEEIISQEEKGKKKGKEEAGKEEAGKGRAGKKEAKKENKEAKK
jgi:large subunit ribosomal protein L32